ncbi:MAG: helix-turn-helix transcriptional regulator [Eubacteriaceae bacterium]|nr:helix-turn-helix transcriptional regulator [Eubacteriaceae bacterium]
MEYKKSEQIRNNLLKAAKHQFYENGFEKTTVRSIAKEAGVNHALAYYHFDGKYDLAHKIIDEYHVKSEVCFTPYMQDEENLLLKLLTLYRFSLREIYNSKKDFDFYIAVYQKVYYDADLIIHLKEILNQYGIDIEDKKLEIATITSSVSWGHLYSDKNMSNQRSTLTNRDIIDAIDIMRWTYLGFEKQYIEDMIEKSYEILENIPMHHLRILEY